MTRDRSGSSPHAGPRLGQGPAAARLLRRTIRLAARGAGVLPPDVAHGAAVVGGTLEWALRPRKRRILSENLAHAAPGLPRRDLRRLVRSEVVNEARRSADLLWALDRPSEMLATLRIEHLDRVVGQLDAGRGVILAGPHIGGWEIVAPVPHAVLGRRATAIVTDDWLAWAMEPLRRASGLRIEYASRPLHSVAARLRRGDVALMFPDIVPPGARTLNVRMLDAEVALPAGPAVQARLGRAPIVPLAVLPIAPRAWRILLGRPIEPPGRRDGAHGEQAVLQQLADAWTTWLHGYPEHWAAVYPLPWHVTPEAREAASPSAVPASTSAT